MPAPKLLILLVVVMIAAAVTIYIGLSFNISPALIAIISIGVALFARLMLRNS